MQWFEGEGQATAFRRDFGVQKMVKKENARIFLASLGKFVRWLGFRGLLVLLDESEMSHSTMRKSSLRDAHNNLLHLINEAESVGGLFLLYAAVPEFFDDPKFGIKTFDRRRHLYVVGKSGSGKSCLLQLLVKNDMERGLGCAVIDPHGDLIDDIMKLVPQHRAKDVVIFDPSDVNFPPSFNPMDPVRPELRVRVALSFLDAFKRVFGSDWSEKMDHVLRYAMLGLLAVPGSNILSLRRMLADEGEGTRGLRRKSAILERAKRSLSG
jgi:hypothetical protein